ncbi:bifunctional YncE family protein/alkaline phosphatase family protein [Microbacter margulisiae]|uniref:YVTN family beta-propeller protein n=1 Tax=Microbacter margulisiae TaxID=1350067 RepID=A0A7W5DPJ0_9PORP|nr:alkaline phosphatase family protein [Microbacter margulisiae]MBB3186383.1 YVTN family beta-propeller protein [Microbacter margulisiae]
MNPFSIRTRHFIILSFSFFLSLLSSNLHAQLPGQTGQRVLLPNGWWLSPAGNSVTLSTMPMNAALSPDEHFLAITHAGMDKPLVMLIDLKSHKVVQSIALKDSWLGITFHGDNLYVSGGNQNCVYTFNLKNGMLFPSDTLSFASPYPKASIFLAGLDVHHHTLAVVARGDSTLHYMNLVTKTKESIHLDGMPYTCKFLDNGLLLVSLWSAHKAELYQGTHKIAQFETGNHPTDIALTKDDNTAYIANANDNSVTEINLKTKHVTATICTSLYPDSPEGSTPDAVCITPDGKFVLAANADNNSLTVMQRTEHGAKPVGFIPVGWYPTKVLVTKDGTILVLNGKGNRSFPNADHQYIGTMLNGTLSFIHFPGTKQLETYTKAVYANIPYKPREMKQSIVEKDNPIPYRVGQPSPIKYVFYVIKENRTYDQVFGDMKEGNGDSTLVLFGKQVTPNIHHIASQYVLLDNLYANAEISAQGHNWSTAAYCTDYVEKSWPSNYAGRGALYEFEGGQPAASPSGGYIWNLCQKHGITFRDYGEFVESNPDITKPNTAMEKILKTHFDPMYRGWDLDYSDVERYQEWNRDFTNLLAKNAVPHFNIIRLPNDHTAGTRKGSLTPQAMVAQNDYAVGLLVDRISHSPIWKESAIFIIEDDSQNGADHVDAHRTEGLVISPYVKRNAVDHTLYTTASMMRTMELILGLPPMSQYDAAAMPMFNSFTMTPDFTPYNVEKPLIDLNAKNQVGAYGQTLMEHFDLTHADRVPDLIFDEIVWRSIKGTDMPAPRFSILSGPDGDDE